MMSNTTTELAPWVVLEGSRMELRIYSNCVSIYNMQEYFPPVLKYNLFS